MRIAGSGSVTTILRRRRTAHGGRDPGKIGVNQAEEKTLNLEIALKLRRELEQKGITAVLTREEDRGFYQEDAENKQVQDLQRRCEFIQKTEPVCAVSIHQNSYSDAEVKGAQVFYYKNSTEGKKLAELLQTSLRENADPENKREVKGNASYYMLKKTDVPLVIVECGFLSNPEEAEQLAGETYQQKLAEALAEGISAYLKEKA